MSVALRTITRLQDADDINVSLGAGVDEYALVYDHDTARFVLRTTAGYDHGLLAAGSLGDDDHTQYALLAGRAGGQTLYGGTAANQTITIHGTSDATRTTSYVLLQPTAGRVGIGTTAPGYPVDILNTTEADVYALNLRASSRDARPGLRMEGLRPDTAGITFDLFKVDIGKVGYAVTQIGKIGAYGRCDNSSSGYYMYLSGVSDASWDVNATLKLSSTNRVGINVPGSDMPATALHVVGAATITGGIRPAANSTTALQLQNASGTSVLNVDTTNARVGIGTTAPATRLDIDAGALTMAEMTAPTGAANKAMLYTKDNGSGKTQLCCKLGDDVEIVIATQA